MTICEQGNKLCVKLLSNGMIKTEVIVSCRIAPIQGRRGTSASGGPSTKNFRQIQDDF